MIYVVTSGCYSDYGIVGVFDDRAKAEACVGDSNDEDGYGSRIEEYGLNDWEAERSSGLKYYCVHMDLNGNVKTVQEGGTGSDSHWIARPPANPVNAAWFSASCWAKDERHAIKIANERRIMALANEVRS